MDRPGGCPHAAAAGGEWLRLPAVVRSAFAPGVWTGALDVRRGRGRLASWIADAWRLPPAGSAVAARVSVTADGARQRWERRLGRHELFTCIYSPAPGVVSEQLGRIRCDFRLACDDAGVTHERCGVRLVLGRAAIPVPWPFAARIRARVEEAGDGAVRVSVGVSAALVGLLLSYEGAVRREEAA